MEREHQLQSDIYKQMVKLGTNFKKTPKERLSVSYIETRLEVLQSYWRDFSNNHTKLLSVPVEDRKLMPYFSNDDYDACLSYYMEIKTKMREMLKPKETDSDLPVVNTKLPPIQIRSFNGHYADWLSFRDLFKSLVHDNPNITKVNKCQYLKSSLTGDAESLVKQIQVSEANYDIIWEMLNKRYNNRRSIVNTYMSRLLNQKKITTESAKSIRELLDVTTECLATLKSLNLPSDGWDDLIVYIIIQKLDPESHKLFEQRIESNDILPTWKDLSEFLEYRFRTLETINTSSKPKDTSRHTSVKTFQSTVTQSQFCLYCKGEHFIYHCKEFCKLDLSKRKEFVLQNNICFNCMKKNHSSKQCLQSTTCRKCKRKHHTILHGYTPNPSSEDTPASDQSPSNTTNTNESPQISTHAARTIALTNCAENFIPEVPVILATALVDVPCPNGKVQTLRALVDQGSQACLITESACQALGLKRTSIQASITGVGSSTALSTSMIQFNIQSRNNPEISVRVTAYTLSSLTSYIPLRSHKIDWPLLNTIPLADPIFNRAGKIDLILGADIYAEILQDGVLTHKTENSTLIAQRTTLGWLISGRHTANNLYNQVTIHHVKMELNSILERFWEIEHSNDSRTLTNDEIKCERFYEATHQRLENGRYQVRMPFTTHPPDLGESLTLATKRLIALERKFHKDPALHEKYNEFMLDYYIQQGHMEPVPIQEIQNSNHMCYIPHHPVINEQHLTTKLRVVYDSSAKTSNHKSLNDNLLVGPALQNDIRDVTLRWRRHYIALVGDIRQMYRMIIKDERDRNYLRILWRFCETDPIQHYRLTTVTYGTSCAPYLAIKTLKQLAEDERPNFSDEVADKVLYDFYIDDLLTGDTTLKKVIELKEEITTLLRKGGFILHKWASNSPAIEGVEQSTRKILGLNWNGCTDKFEAKIELPPIKEPVTKRTILRDIAMIYDPTGWLAPVVIVAKCMLQKLWMEKVDWDDILPEPLLQEWMKFRQELTDMPTIEIDRWLGITEEVQSIQLHGFSDASSIAYSSVVYCRVITNYRVMVTLLESRTRVAPVKQISLPRLELCGSVMLAKLIHRIQTALSISTHSVYAWTDATIVLAWLQRPPSYWTIFVANRVTEITNIIDKERWHHVSSQENPADVASRGISPKDLPHHELWWRGPSWLSEMSNPPCHRPDSWPTTELEKKVSVKVSVQSGVVSDKGNNSDKSNNSDDTNLKQCLNIDILGRYSSLSKLIRIVSYMWRFYVCCKHKANTKQPLIQPGYLTCNELQSALTVLLKLSQHHNLKSEIGTIKQTSNGKDKFKALKGLEHGIKIARLDPFVDEDGLLRVGGRIHNSELNSNMKHPVILTKDCKLSLLIVRDAHYKTLHGGIQLMLNVIRAKYHIIGVRYLVKNVIRTCSICCRQAHRLNTQLMGNLPKDRVTPQRPFYISGVDFAGPVVLKFFSGRGSNKTVKAYIAIFVCTAVKAIHLELVTSLTSEGFISAFRRFSSRRGHCFKLISDCGTNFVRASKDLKESFADCTKGLPKEISDLLARDGTTWQFNPAGAPHMSGLAESAVKSAKFHLNRVLSDTKLTYEEYSTLLCQIESCLNSRPLVPLNEDSEGVSALTPGHFLIGEIPIVVPDKNFENVNVPYVQRWVYLQQKLQSFWRKWSYEYLTNLQKRYKWNSVQANIKVGDVVLIKDERLPPSKWLMGKIVATHPGSDGLVRVVSIQCKDTLIKRPIHKLCLLPLSD